MSRSGAPPPRPDVSEPLSAVLLGILLLCGSVWLGGWTTMIMVARTATATLPPAHRVAFFRKLGRVYGIVTTIALLIALAAGAALLFALPWQALSGWIVGLAVVLLIVLGAGVAQARAQTRARTALAASPGDQSLAARVRTTAMWAGLLRAFLGVISIAIGVLALILAA